jgi:putative hydrolase of the HAD superfamily
LQRNTNYDAEIMMTVLPRFSAGQTLLLDADDTLWENNIYFERAFTAFISYLNHRTYTYEGIRTIFHEVEKETIRDHGYGIASFCHCLIACFEQLSMEPITPENHKRIMSFSQLISEHEIQLLASVAEVLPMLASRLRLILVTKGNRIEQIDKFTRSGIERYFVSMEVPHEKDPNTYIAICQKCGLQPSMTWMVGNSPRSDINPALAAGLHAVLIHNENTWVFEQEVIDTFRNGQHFFELAGFHELALLF